jgi:sigma-B regulation protein RsbU (phosphoserine phosphatase)
MFATVFLGLLDPRDGTLTYINAGHESPLVLHSDGGCAPLNRTGPALGVIPNAEFGIQRVQLQRGDLLFAFTDGAPDALDPAGKQFSRERLFSLLHADISAEALLAELNAYLHAYIAEADQFDDITLLAVRRLAL